MLQAWRAIADPEDRVIACFGDSTTEGTVGVTNGGYPEQLRQLMVNRWGQTADYGFYGTWRDHWSFTSGGDAWTLGTISEAWSVGPFQAGTPNASVMFANGSSKVATWSNNLSGSNTIVATTGVPVNSFSLYMVDGSGAGNFSYRLGGVFGSWTNVSETWNNDNSIKVITVNSEILTGSLEVRAANSAGTAVNTYLIGVQPHSLTTGPRVHNMGVNGKFLSTFVRTTGPDWGKWIDIVQPKIAIVMFTNDLLLWSQANWETQLNAFISRVRSNGGEPIIMTMCGQNGRENGNYDQQRSSNQSVAAAQGVIHINFYDIMGDYATANAAGYMADNLHPSNKGAQLMAQHIWSHIGSTGNGARFRIG
jgi:lysophospholipase L1-like esterase